MFKLRAALLVVGFIGIGYSMTFAQSDTTCDVVIDDVLETIQTQCSDLGSGQACLAENSSTFVEGESPISPDENIVALEDIQGIQVSEAWGIAILEIAAGSDDLVHLAVFGDAQITNAVVPSQGTSAILNVSNSAGYNVNLREGPTTNAAAIGLFEWNEQGTVDGRSADGTWLHVTIGDKVGWVAASLTALDGDINTLAILDNPYVEPMQALMLESSSSSEGDDTPCGAGSSGVLVWYEGETPAQIQINHVDLSFTASTLLVQAQANDEMLLHVIDGALDLQSNGRAFGVNSGDAAAITLGGDDGLTPINSPLLSHAYSFAAIRGAPLELISSVSDSDQENAVCIVGVDDYVRTLAQPSDDAREMLNLDPNLHYQVTGQFSEGETRWFQLDGDSNPSWVRQDSVDTVGACAGIAEIEWNPPVAGSSSSSSGSAGDGAANSSSGVPFVPTGQSVWSATSGQEFSTGTCNFPPLAMCQHLVAITLNDDGTISWRGQEPTAYQLYSSGDNFYSFEGRNKLGNANISMGLSFQGESGWTMTMTQIFDNDPQCIRTFYYSASRQW